METPYEEDINLVEEDYVQPNVVTKLHRAIQHDDLDSFINIINTDNICIMSLYISKLTYNGQYDAHFIIYSMQYYASEIIKWTLKTIYDALKDNDKVNDKDNDKDDGRDSNDYNTSYEDTSKYDIDNQLDSDCNTPLMLAISVLGHGDSGMDNSLISIIDSLLRYGNSNCNYVNNDGKTPLWLLLENEEYHVMNCKTNTFNKVYNMLIAHDADPYYTMPYVNLNNHNVIMTDNDNISNVRVHDSIIHMACRNLAIPNNVVGNLLYTIYIKSKALGDKFSVQHWLQLYDEINQTPLAIAISKCKYNIAMLMICLDVVLDNSDTFVITCDNLNSKRMMEVYKIAKLPIDDTYRILTKYVSAIYYTDIHNGTEIENTITDIVGYDNAAKVIDIHYNDIIQYLDKWYDTMHIVISIYKMTKLISLIPLENRSKYHELNNILMTINIICNSIFNNKTLNGMNIVASVNKIYLKEDTQTECCICYTNHMSSQLVVLNCPGEHWCCLFCLKKLIDSSPNLSCPMCRHPIPI